LGRAWAVIAVWYSLAGGWRGHIQLNSCNLGQHPVLVVRHSVFLSGALFSLAASPLVLQEEEEEEKGESDLDKDF
jgi:hypothetical protein